MDLSKVDRAYANPLANLAMEPATPRTPGTLPPCPGDLKALGGGKTPARKQWIQDLLPEDLEALDDCLDECLTDSYREDNPLAQGHPDDAAVLSALDRVVSSSVSKEEDPVSGADAEEDIWAGLDDDYDLQEMLRNCDEQVIEEAYVEGGMNKRMEVKPVEWPEDTVKDSSMPLVQSEAALSRYLVDDWTCEGLRTHISRKKVVVRSKTDQMLALLKKFDEARSRLEALAPDFKMRREIEEIKLEQDDLQQRRENLKVEAEGSTVAMMMTAKQIQESLGGLGSEAAKEAQKKLQEKILTLRLKTVKPSQAEYFAVESLAERRRKFREEFDAKTEFMARMEETNWTTTRLKHWLFFGDRPREITEDEAMMDVQIAKDQAIRSRKERSGWNPFQVVQGSVERAIGPCTTQIFLFYQFIMINNLVMSNMWTFFVILPWVLDPPPAYQADAVTWAGLLGLDDKGLEYSWFYYGAYAPESNIGGFTYRVDVAYIVIMVFMFFVQLSIMGYGVYTSVKADKTIRFEADDPLDGIRNAASILACLNFSIVDGAVQRDLVANTFKYLKESIYDQSALLADEDNFERPEGMSDEAVQMIFAAKKREEIPEWRVIVGRTVGFLLYIGLFQISTNGIRACYENEKAIRDIFPYGVPLLVTSMRILVPVIFVPLFLKLEFRTEQSYVYQSIGRSFLLKMYTMNCLLQILVSIDPPDNLCSATFIGKVYWRQEMTDLLFTIVMDLVLTLRRTRQTPRPEFDSEEFAERVMEILYRQAFIWVAAPYSPMLAYLAIFSTSILYYLQCMTVPISYSPPIHGWSFQDAEKNFRIALLLTAVATLYPSWTFFHTTMTCGPHGGTTPYKFMEGVVAGWPGIIRDILVWGTKPTVVIALLTASIVMVAYLANLLAFARRKLNAIIVQSQLEYGDKVQILRSNGIPY